MSSSTDVASLLVQAAVPGFKCPTGTKMHFLNLGTLEADESWYVPWKQSVIETRPFVQHVYSILRILRGGNTSTLSNKNPENKRRELLILSALIEYPGVGLILYETGCAEDLDVVRRAFMSHCYYFV